MQSDPKDSTVTLDPISAASPDSKPAQFDDIPLSNSTTESTSTDIQKHQSPADPTFVKVPLEKPKFILVFVGLTLAILLAALDQTIVSTALRAIATDLGGQDLIPWIGSAYLLTSTSTSALYGKFADIFGRKWVFVFAIVVFEIGSFICGAASTMTMLVIGRGVAGIGGGGIFSLVLIIISDIVSIQDRGKYQGIVGAVFGLASVIGPLIGGAFSDSVSWRWCFYLNLPVGAITVVAVLFFLNFPAPEGSIRSKLAQIDLLGSILLFLGVVCLITPIQLGGSIWPWESAQTLAMLIISVPILAGFIYVEMKVAKDPIIPPSLFVNRSVPALLLLAFSLGSTFISTIYYISLFFQISYGDSATTAGLKTFPLVVGLVFFSILSGQLVSRFGRYTPFLFIGSSICIVAIGLLSTLSSSSPFVIQLLYLFIVGCGIGNLVQIRVLAIQAAVPQDLIAVATAVSQFSQSLGGTVGIAITGTLFNNLFSSNLANFPALEAALTSPALIALLQKAGSRGDPIGLRPFLEILGLTEALQGLVSAFEGAFQVAYRWILPFACLMLVCACFVKPTVIKKPAGDEEEGKEAAKEVEESATGLSA
ncbi:hypothetical protein HDV05_002727 [Chytridiales sp. JEL 0842]|nr:hypothetical protein HDV05_002727 [Chytridiales sp. JEL 0842]